LSKMTMCTFRPLESIWCNRPYFCTDH